MARIAEAVGLGLFTVAVMFILSWCFGACVDVPEWHTVRASSPAVLMLWPNVLLHSASLSWYQSCCTDPCRK